MTGQQVCEQIAEAHNHCRVHQGKPLSDMLPDQPITWQNVWYISPSGELWPVFYLQMVADQYRKQHMSAEAV